MISNSNIKQFCNLCLNSIICCRVKTVFVTLKAPNSIEEDKNIPLFTMGLKHFYIVHVYLRVSGIQLLHLLLTTKG